LQEAATFGDRLLAEAVRAEEESQGHLHLDEDAAAAATAQSTSGDLETRVVMRARLTPRSLQLRAGLLRLRKALTLATAIALVLAVAAGAGTAAAALGAGGGAAVNVYVALGAVLGVNFLALAAWMLLVVIRPRADATASLGGLVWLIGQRLSRWLGRGAPASSAALKALAVTGTRSGAARWALSAVSHGFWAVFCAGAVITALFLLGTRQYLFTWETTILSAQTYVPLTQAIAALPGALGFPVPGLGEIEASQWTGSGDSVPRSAAEAWSGFLVGSILVYGLVPRVLLLIVCLALTARATRRYRLDLNVPAFAMVAKRLDPDARRLGVTDADTGESTEPAPAVTRPEPTPGAGNFGPRTLLGLEIDAPASGWPPLSAEIEWLDLGFVDSREQRQAASARLHAALPPPYEVVVVCSLAATPDRGSERFLSALAAGQRVAMLLTEGELLRRGGADHGVEPRVSDWRSLARRIGVPAERVLEIDLEHMTDNSARRLRKFLGAVARRPPLDDARGDSLAAAFARIVDSARSWKSTPDAVEQAELHREIARIYRGRGDGWKALLGATRDPGSNPLAMLEQGANRMMEILPARLRASRDWIASGAVAGAMACVAAATLATPVALAALPVWAGLGGALSWVLKERLGSAETKREPIESAADIGGAVRAAALFAVLLELQGLDEGEITRVLDQVFDLEVPALRSPSEVEDWLRSVRERLPATGARK
jgi:hypothetical protein